jgi:hypothetical protein
MAVLPQVGEVAPWSLLEMNENVKHVHIRED